MTGSDKLKDFLSSKKFETEHALNMYADGFVCLPAAEIYNEELLEKHAKIISNCHIYIVGLAPKIDFVGAHQDGETLNLVFTVKGEEHTVSGNIPGGAQLMQDETGAWFVITEDGNRIWPDMETVLESVKLKVGGFDFKVLYIGQAFGEDGSRNAIDRLKKHETLQKISLKGIPDGFVLSLILLEVEKGNQLITMFNPWAKNGDDGKDRIAMGLDKLFETTEAERTSLFEASMIRYFKPEFNTIFKDSFPSTNLKTLADCYDKDIATVVAEICIDELPFRLFSDAVAAAPYHIARHDLHKDEDRQVFFSSEIG